MHFLSAYPKMSLKVLDIHSTVDLFTAVANGLVDVAITYLEYREKGLICEPLLKIYRHVYASPDYIKKYGCPRTVAELVEHNCLVSTRNAPDSVWFFEGSSIKVSGSYQSNSPAHVVSAAEEGLGLIWSTESLVANEVKKGSLVKIELDHPACEMGLAIYYRPVYAGHPVKVFVEFVKAYLNRE
ncbi:LysR substrate-binding domain-containing protein [Piscirickettsia litoralis]|uniref:LysR substrate-binding domain-containing protein n=1 Tax=Piscirickettsia litoralis TaxID=1891921 RepID=A0ABX3A8H4_9GAMM|nr:LysR substrate-binding domain-containing protein [Piscirickettsia litoralis]ODN43735.1 hypothetical protein BGC07_13550 [Piscirickettsia litoralis]